MRQINPPKYKIGDIVRVVKKDNLLNRCFAEIDSIIKTLDTESPDKIFFYQYVLSITYNNGINIVVSEDETSDTLFLKNVV